MMLIIRSLVITLMKYSTVLGIVTYFLNQTNLGGKVRSCSVVVQLITYYAIENITTLFVEKIVPKMILEKMY